MDNPVFVKIDEFKDIAEVLNLTKEKLQSAKIILDKIERLKQEENNEIEKWHKKLDEINQRVSFIDKTLMR